MTAPLFGEMPDDVLLDALWATPGWPQNEARDRALLLELARQFPELDLRDQLGRFAVFVLERDLAKEVSGRGRYMRLRNWCKQTRKPFGRVGRARAQVWRGSAAPGGVGDFGAASSSGLASW